MYYCTKCGAQNSKTSVCTNCGSSVAHKSSLAVWSLVVSIISLCISGSGAYFYYLQDKKWDAVNQPRIVFSGVRLRSFRNTSSVKPENDGPPYFIYVDSKKGSKSVEICYQYATWSREAGEPSSLHNPQATLAEAVKELEQNKVSDTLEIRKRIIFDYSFKNAGALPANKVMVKIELSDSDWSQYFTQILPAHVEVIEGKEEFQFNQQVLLPVNIQPPEILKIKMRLNYSFANVPQPSEVRDIVFSLRHNRQVSTQTVLGDEKNK